MASKPVRWGILGAANWAVQHMGPAIHAAKDATLAAVASSSPDKVAPFAAFAPGVRHTTYEGLLADPDVDAIYIPLPNHMHVEWTRRCLEAGKPVLTEKPLAMRADEIDDLIALRDRTGLLAAEAYMIAHHPQWIRTRALLASGAIGRLVHVSAAFCYFNDDPTNIRNRADAGGGGARDIGVYAMGCVPLATGQQPERLTHARVQAENGVDIFAEFGFDFPGFTYQGFTGIRMANRQEVTFHGTEAVLTLTCPFNANLFDQAELHIARPDGTVTTERYTGVNQYVLQVEAFGRSLRNGDPWPWSFEDAKGSQAMIDAVLARM